MATREWATDDPMFGTSQGSQLRDARRRELNRQLSSNRLEERGYRRAYRDALRRNDSMAALRLVQDATNRNIQFTGIQSREDNLRTAQQAIAGRAARSEAYSPGMRRGLGGSFLPEEPDNPLLPAREQLASTQVSSGLTPDERSDFDRRFSDFESTIRSDSSLWGDTDQRTDLRRKLAGLAPVFNPDDKESRDRFGFVLDKLGVDRERGFDVLRRRSKDFFNRRGRERFL